VSKGSSTSARCRGASASSTRRRSSTSATRSTRGSSAAPQLPAGFPTPPPKILPVGGRADAMVLGVDPTARRISLGLKQVETNPWHDLADKYPVGSKITGKVRNLTEFGAFVEVEEEIDGLIHISDMSWSKRIKHPSEVLKKGDVVDAMVLNIDAENQRLSLGLKQLATDIWDDFFTRHHVGDTIEGKVVRMTN